MAIEPTFRDADMAAAHRGTPPAQAALPAGAVIVEATPAPPPPPAVDADDELAALPDLRVLPAKIRRILLGLRSDRHAAWAVHAVLSNERSTVFTETLAAEAELRRVEFNYRDALASGTPTASAAEAQAALEPLRQRILRLKAELALITERSAAAAARWEGFALVDELDKWVARANAENIKLKQVGAEIAKPPRDLRAAIEAARAEIAALDATQQEVEQAPPPVEQAIALMEEHVDRVAAAGAPTIWARNRDQSPVNIDRIHDASAFTVWLHADAVKARLADELRANALPGAMADADRDAAIARIAEQRLAVERHEETLIRLAADQGIAIGRRRDANPLAVLGVEIVDAARPWWRLWRE